MLTRRVFLELGTAAAICSGCRNLIADDAVRFGIISDTHATGDDSVAELVRAFSFLRDKGVDAVIHCGDMTDFGYVAQLEAFAKAWRQAMPKSIPLIPVLGNRDLSDTGKMSEEKRAADKEKLIMSDPERILRRTLGVNIDGGIRACWIRGVPVVAADWNHGAKLESFMRRHQELRDPDRPLIYVQHSHPGGTVVDVDKPGDDPVTCWLNMFPRAVSISGHSHIPFVNPGTFCRREFTAIGAGSHYLSDGPEQKGIREVSVLNIDASGVRLERFRMHNGFHDVLTRPFPASAQRDKDVPGSFVFALWNIGGFCLGQDGSAGAVKPERASDLRRQIAAVDADFFALAEYEPAFKLSGGLASETVFGLYPHAFAGPRLGANGNAILSRNVPLASGSVNHFPHRTQKRYFVACEAIVAGARTTIVHTHLDLDAKNRRLQLDELLKRFGSLKHIIISADFNQDCMKAFDPFVKAGFQIANGGKFGTFLTHRRRNTSFTPAIDNVLVKGFDILSVRTEDNSMTFSDHRMLVCRLVKAD